MCCCVLCVQQATTEWLLLWSKELRAVVSAKRGLSNKLYVTTRARDKPHCAGICNGCHWLCPPSPCCSPLPLFLPHAALLAHAGIGGDAFCLYFDAKTKKVTAMLGNGGAPGALTLQVTQ